MSNSGLDLWEVAKDKLERLQQAGAQDRLAAEYSDVNPGVKGRRVLLLVVVGMLGALLWMLAG